MAQKMIAGLDSFPLMAIPFFLLAAELMASGALAEVLLRFASLFVGHKRGGLGYTNILTITFFSGNQRIRTRRRRRTGRAAHSHDAALRLSASLCGGA